MHARTGAGLLAVLLITASFVAAPRLADARQPQQPGAPVGGAGVAAQLVTFCESFCTLYVTLGGNGTGRWQTTNITLEPDGAIDCRIVNGVVDTGSTCSHSYGPKEGAYTIYYLMTAAPGSEACEFTECDDTYDSLTTLSSTRTVNNDFRLIPYPLTVTTGGTGSGSVFSTPSGIACGSTCANSWDYGTSILLTAIPDAGSTFAGWTGSCAEQPADCLIAIIGPLTTKALFNGAAATAKPPKTPAPTHAATAAPATAAPTEPGVTAGPLPTIVDGTPTPPPAAPSAGAGVPTTPPTVPAVSSTDSTTLALILFVLAALLIVAGIVFVAFTMGRRRSTPPPS